MLIVFALSDSSSAISVTVFPEAIWDMTSYSRSESVSCGVRVRSSVTPKASFSASAGLTYRPPARILFQEPLRWLENARIDGLAFLDRTHRQQTGLMRTLAPIPGRARSVRAHASR